MDSVNGAQSSVMVPSCKHCSLFQADTPCLCQKGLQTQERALAPAHPEGSGWGPSEIMSSSHSLLTGGENVLGALG